MRKIRAALVAAAWLAGAVPAQAAWFEARSDHFVVYAQGDAARARDQAIALERFDKGMRLLRNMPDDPTAKINPLTVFVVNNVGAVRKLCQQGSRAARGVCADVAGFYDGRASGSVAFMPQHAGDGGKLDMNSQIILFHEYSHHIMFQYFTTAYPAWFVEGFAEFNSTTKVADDGSLLIGGPAYHRAYSLLLTAPLRLPLLLTARGPELNPIQREQLYARGWLLCHYLTFTPARQGQLTAYLTKVAGGTPSLDAATQTFGDLAKLDAELDGYLKVNLTYAKLPADKTQPGTVAVRQLGAGEAAIMPVRIRSKRGVSEAIAGGILKEARELAAPYPNDPAVQDALAEAAFDAGDDAEAQAAADRALAAAPDDRTALLYKGRVHMRQALTGKKTDAATWAEVRSWFRKANVLQPDAAEPLLLFYQSFLAQGITPTANAALGLAMAHQLAPQDGGLRLLFGRQLILDHRPKEARAVLSPLAFDPHADPASNPAAAMIAAIDKGDENALQALIRLTPDGDSAS